MWHNTLSHKHNISRAQPAIHPERSEVLDARQKIETPRPRTTMILFKAWNEKGKEGEQRDEGGVDI